jgi:hypothetical protein
VAAAEGVEEHRQAEAALAAVELVAVAVLLLAADSAAVAEGADSEAEAGDKERSGKNIERSFYFSCDRNTVVCSFLSSFLQVSHYILITSSLSSTACCQLLLIWRPLGPILLPPAA